MKSTSKIVVASAALGAALFTGCNNVPDDVHPLYAKHNQGYNALGLVERTPESYEHVSEYSAALYTDESLNEKNITGDHFSLFWGTIVIADYASGDPPH